ncbi:MAG: DUF5804 family protein [Methanomicrobiales archaeon]|nr:DUF5804 family protein [Methanomicrobiales archaeon]
MKILLVPKPGVDLYRTLYDSETSRAILRFYKPGRHPWGVEITVSSLGSAVSLISELRWYLQRYIQEVLIDLGEGVVISRALAREVYQRDLTLTSPWPHRMRFRLERGRIRRSLIEEGSEPAAQVSAPERVPVPLAPEPAPVPGSPEPGAVSGAAGPHAVQGTSEPAAGPTPEPVPAPVAPEPVSTPGSPQSLPLHAPVAPEAITIDVWTTPDEPVEDVVADEEAAPEPAPDDAGESSDGPGPGSG